MIWVNNVYVLIVVFFLIKHTKYVYKLTWFIQNTSHEGIKAL